MAYLLKLKKEDMLGIAKELGVEAHITLTKVEIMNRICHNESYDDEIVKAVMEGVLEERQEKNEKEKERNEKEKERLEFEERRQIREFELERMKLSHLPDTLSVSSADLESQGLSRRVNLKDLVPKFDAKKADINLFFEIFERQAKKEKVGEDKWVSQLIPLLPMEIAEIVAKEPPEKGDDYTHIKNVLLNRFQLTPVALRDRFESHQRRPGTLWADLIFDLRSYLDNWLAGMKVIDFVGLKELMLTEQLKKRAPIELVDHFIDSWDEYKEATILAEKLDHFEAVKKVNRKQVSAKTGERRSLGEKFETGSCSSKNRPVGSPKKDDLKDELNRESRRERERQFEKKRQIVCYYCNEVGHIKPSCSKLLKNNFETVANLKVNTEDDDLFEKFKMKMKINGVERMCLRHSGSSIDVCPRSWVRKNDRLRENVWLKSPLDDMCHYLPLIKVKIKTKGGYIFTKAVVKPYSQGDDIYLLGNRTARLIEPSEQGVQWTNRVEREDSNKGPPRWYR